MIEKMVKMVVTDIDGTLVPESCMNINPEYYEIIEKLNQKGIRFAVATGRHPCSVKKLFAPVLDKIWIIGQNGAVIERNGKSEVLKPIPTRWIRELWQDISQIKDMDCIIETADMTYCSYADTPMYDIILNNYNFDIQATGGWDKVPDVVYSMATIYYPENVERMVDENLREKWEGRLTLCCTGKLWVDCFMHGISKGNAAHMIAKREGVLPEEVIAFGDNLNDISMLEMAGTGYAVANARAEVRAAADIVIPSVFEDGALNVLRELAN